MKSAKMFSVVAALIGVAVSCNQAMALSPPAAPFTLWNFLGIPQGFNKIRDATSNSSGNRPNRERQPPLKAIADPANLMSPNPAISAAAKIKTEEDLAPQKIKALKYLSTIGCGCYPDVKEALMGALDDCTEEVRYEAVLAITDAASQHCAVCNKNCCCDQEMTLKLSQIAYERNDQGCWLEVSERVREAAKQAMRACCPGQGPISPQEAAPENVPESIPEGATPPPSPLPATEERGAHRVPAPRPRPVPATRVQETSSTTIRQQETTIPDDNVDVVTVDFGNQTSPGGRPSPVTATRRSSVPAAQGVKAPAAKPQPTSGAQLGPSSRRAAAERGLGVPKPLVNNKQSASLASSKQPAATPARATASHQTPAPKQQTNDISGWGWPMSGNTTTSNTSTAKPKSTSSPAESARGPVRASYTSR